MKSTIPFLVAVNVALAGVGQTYGEELQFASYADIEAAFAAQQQAITAQQEEIAAQRLENEELRARLSSLESRWGDCSPAVDLCCGCCACSDTCCCGVDSGWMAGASIYCIKPYWENNPAFGTRAWSGPSPGTYFYTQTDLDWDHEAAWDVWLGYVVPNGFGLRTRYWEFNHSLSVVPGMVPEGGKMSFVAAPLGVASATDGITFAGVDNESNIFASQLRLRVFDIEAAQAFTVGCWEWDASAGLRYARHRQTYDWSSTFYSPSVVNRIWQFTTLESSHDFDGFGPVVALAGRRATACKWLDVYAKTRGAILVGKSNAFASHVVETGPLDNLSPGPKRVARVSQWDTLPIAEVEIGVEASQTVGNVRAFLEVGLVGYAWLGAGNASNSGAVNGRDMEFRPDDSDNLTLFGGRLAAGTVY